MTDKKLVNSDGKPYEFFEEPKAEQQEAQTVIPLGTAFVGTENTGNELLEAIKTDYSALLNNLYQLRDANLQNQNLVIFANMSITDLQKSFMWAEKLATWKY